MSRIRCLAVFAVLLTLGCAPRTGVETAADRGPTLEVVPVGEWPTLTDDEDLESLVHAAAISVEYFERLPSDRRFRFGAETRTAGELSRGLQRFVEIVSANEPGPASDTVEVTADPMNLGGAGGGNHFANFIYAVRTGNQADLTCPVATGFRSDRLHHLANISYRVGRRLEYDAARERFVGDREADRLLTRNYRRPYVVE